MQISPLRAAYYRLPLDLQHAILIRRRSAIWLRAGVVFVHIPKAAGTSINQMLYGRFMGHVSAASIERWSSASVKALPKVAVSRNPWDRLVSAYRFAVRRPNAADGSPAAIWRAERYQIPEFESFDHFVTDWLASRDIRRLDGVFQPQWPFVCDQSGSVLIDHLGKVEDLGPTLVFLSEHFNAAASMGHLNRSGEPVDYRHYYTPELAALVGRIYARDVEVFGYHFEEGT